MKNILILFLALCSVLYAKDYTRCVSLSPAVTEMICAIGAEDKLIARSRFCDYPQSVKKLQSSTLLSKILPQALKISKLWAKLTAFDR